MEAQVVLRIDGQRYGVPLLRVSRVVRAVEITRVPTAPEVFMGVIDIGGEIRPVVDLRLRLNIDRREIDADDCMLVARSSVATLVLPVDAVLGIAGALEAPLAAHDAPIHPDCVGSVLSDADGLVLVLDLDGLVTADQYAVLQGLSSEQASA